MSPKSRRSALHAAAEPFYPPDSVREQPVCQDPSSVEPPLRVSLLNSGPPAPYIVERGCTDALTLYVAYTFPPALLVPGQRHWVPTTATITVPDGCLAVAMSPCVAYLDPRIASIEPVLYFQGVHAVQVMLRNTGIQPFAIVPGMAVARLIMSRVAPTVVYETRETP